jgi:hypothetical protein
MLARLRFSEFAGLDKHDGLTSKVRDPNLKDLFSVFKVESSKRAVEDDWACLDRGSL